MKKILFTKSDPLEYIHYSNRSTNFELMFRLGQIEIETVPGVKNITLDLMIHPGMFGKKMISNIVIGEKNVGVAEAAIYYDTVNDFVIDLILKNFEDTNITYNPERFRSQYDFTSIIDNITESNEDNVSIFDAMVLFLSSVCNNIILKKYFKFVYRYLRFFKQETVELECQLLSEYPSPLDSDDERVVFGDILRIPEWNDDNILQILESVFVNPIRYLESYLNAVTKRVIKIESLGPTSNEKVEPMREILKILLNIDVKHRTTFLPLKNSDIRGYGFGVIHGFPIHYTLNEELDTVIYSIEKEYSDNLFIISEETYDKNMREVGKESYSITNIEIYDKLPSTTRTNLILFNDLLKNLYGDSNNNFLLKVLSKNLRDMTTDSGDVVFSRDSMVSFGFTFNDGLLLVTPTVNPLVVELKRFYTLMTDGNILFKRNVNEVLMNDVIYDYVDRRYILQTLGKIYDIAEEVI